MQTVLERIGAMSEREVSEILRAGQESFVARHRDLEGVLDRNFAIITERLDHLELRSASLSMDRRRLIGAYFTHEFSIEAAALTNPSMVAGP